MVKADLRAELLKILPEERVLSSLLDRVAWAGDASFYEAIPRAVVFPNTVVEVQALFSLCRRLKVPATFRAGGTSLSGQSITDGILISVTRHWKKCEPREDGKLVCVEPGVIGSRVNQALARFGSKIGPDPASLDSCMMGGILANNSSGMCCGTARNAYKTLRAMKILLPSGTIVDSSAPGASEKLKDSDPKLFAELIAMRDDIRKSEELTDKIKKKYRIKNTMGYSLNSFLDYSDPVDILSHLMIGSEGTLGFIVDATLETIIDARFKATALLSFDSVRAACAQVPSIEKSGAQAIELMDRRLLVEYQFATKAERDSRVLELETLLQSKLETDPGRQAQLWKTRKGIFPAIASRRPPGTSVLIEDVAVPVDHLADAVEELRKILDRNGYQDGAIFGHAKDGNLHFVISQSFNEQASVSRYQKMMNEVVDLIAHRFEGSLKAEHGTGRNMAPFVELEWGSEAYRMMKRIKAVIDPENFLNPGVILNEDPEIHLKNLKRLPAVDSETDRCMECGYCEPKCPSRNLTLSPRQRIAVRRAMSREPSMKAELARDFQYAGIDTCAADGTCAAACPVEIDTGELIKRLRMESNSWVSRKIAAFLAENFKWLELFSWIALRLGIFTRVLNRWFHPTQWAITRSSSQEALSLGQSREDYDVVYFPSCVNRVLGGDTPETVMNILTRAKRKVFVPKDLAGNCCGTPFRSKGFPLEGDHLVKNTLDLFWKWSRQGQIPVLVDTSPCALAFKEAANHYKNRYEGLRVLDSVEFAIELLPSLSIQKMTGSIALHPVCSVQKMNTQSALLEVARACAEDAFIPPSTKCCGFAGDRGVLRPELTASATQEQAKEVLAQECRGFFSTSTTCEIALSQATGKPYQSIWHLLKNVSR
jgi:D-lactate dehydrogenase